MNVELNEDEVIDIIMSLEIMDNEIEVGIIKEDIKKLKNKFRDILEMV
jgi:hypothetical protein